jgi:hypothetical protein
VPCCLFVPIAPGVPHNLSLSRISNTYTSRWPPTPSRMPSSCQMSPAANYYHRPSPQVPQHSGIAAMSRAQVTETQSTLPAFQVTGTYPYDPALISTNSHSPASPSSAQSSPSQDPTREKKTLLCYYYLWGEHMAYTIHTERSPTRGMGREHGHIVGNLIFFFFYVQLSYLQH